MFSRHVHKFINLNPCGLVIFINYVTFNKIRCPRVLHHIIIRRIERRAIFRDDFDRNNFLEPLGLIIAHVASII